MFLCGAEEFQNEAANKLAAWETQLTELTAVLLHKGGYAVAFIDM